MHTASMIDAKNGFLLIGGLQLSHLHLQCHHESIVPPKTEAPDSSG